MSKRQSHDRRRRLSSKHLVLIAVLALFGAGGTFAMVTGSASAAWRNNSTTAQQQRQNNNNNGRNNGRINNNGQNNNGGGNAAGNANAQDPAARTNGPVADDFVDITAVQANVQKAVKANGGSTGSFVAKCGKNENKHFNPDNFIVAPGVSNGAQHFHDYVGNLTTDGFSTNETLAAGGTTCANNDKSAYFWPVLRNLSADDKAGADNNTGTILTADSVTIKFKGSPVSQVTAMPETLKVIMGDAKALTNGTGNAKAAWSCTGFEDKVQLADKYPLCPNGSKVVRTLNFPNCWDGVNTDSANHRTHIVFPDGAGQCQAGFKAVPQLQFRLVYTVASGTNFAVDSFPDQNHKPVTDHADFANFTGADLMNKIVGCINSGKNC